MASNLRTRLHHLFHEHEFIRHNPYTEWFAQADLTKEEVTRFTREFSVFSHQFLVAQLHKVLASPNLESYHAGKEILLNELGVAFRHHGIPPEETSPELASAAGTVNGSIYRHASAHFEWLVAFAAPLGLSFRDLGQRQHGSHFTLEFCDAAIRLYGSSDPNVAAGASYAIEHWAAAGFWKDLIQGLQRFKDRSGLPLNLGFWVFHDRLEQQHANHTADELALIEAAPGFDADAFLEGAHGLLDAIEGFWNGLAASRGQTTMVLPEAKPSTW